MSLFFRVEVIYRIMRQRADFPSYVHRLIQTRTDGKLVELPSASSLVTSLSRPLPFSSTSARPTSTPSPSADQAGPSSNDVDKMSAIEAITLEYSYLLSSQLEAMRQYYESLITPPPASSEIDILRIQAASAAAALRDAELAREKAEKKALKAVGVAKDLAKNLEAEKAMSEGLAERVRKLNGEVEETRRSKMEAQDEVKGLEETVRDLMFSLEAGMKIQEAGGVDAGEGGDLFIKPGEAKVEGEGKAMKGKKKRK